MLYQVSRNGQMYGPYTLEDLQRYVASGNVLLSDLARGEDMAEWVPVSQVVGGEVPPAAPAGVPPGVPPQPAYGVVPAPGAPVPMYQGGVSPYPDPPNLHWGLLLVIGIFTCGLFLLVWDIVQAVWMRRVNPRSNALFYYIGGDVLYFGGTFIRMMFLAAGTYRHNPYLAMGISGIIGIVTFVLFILGRFDMRSSLEEHYNGAEPIGLTLSPVMTFFFGSLYFQYHMSRINEMKRMARYRGSII